MNLRAEPGIMRLHDKMDALRERQFVELLERQAEVVTLLKAGIEQKKN